MRYPIAEMRGLKITSSLCILSGGCQLVQLRKQLILHINISASPSALYKQSASDAVNVPMYSLSFIKCKSDL